MYFGISFFNKLSDPHGYTFLEVKCLSVVVIHHQDRANVMGIACKGDGMIQPLSGLDTANEDDRSLIARTHERTNERRCTTRASRSSQH